MVNAHQRVMLYGTIPSNGPLQFESLLALNSMAESMFDGDSLGVIGWLEQGIEVRLLHHRHCYRRCFAENEFGDNIDRNKTGSIVLELFTYSTIQGLYRDELSHHCMHDGGTVYLRGRAAVIDIRVQAAVVAEIEFIIKIIHSGAQVVRGFVNVTDRLS
jgi:hypothetical protein